MSVKVYIDGQEGTTGLKILERFENRNDIEWLRISEEKRKDTEERKKLINSSDYTFLCLPDVAAVEAVSLVENENVRIIDASTAHRTNPEWAYGFPELSPEHRAKIASSKRVAVPGCYASGFAAIVYPLVANGIMPKDYPVVCHAVSGYSGAGKKAIAQYEAADRDEALSSPRAYALNLKHKHVPEMMKISGLDYAPIFDPIVDDYFSGMVVTVPLYRRLLSDNYSVEQISDMYKKHYFGSSFVSVAENPSDNFIAANALSGKNNMELFINGNEEQIFIASRLDNLGKGASGAAVQCLNIMMGIDEKTGLL